MPSFDIASKQNFVTPVHQDRLSRSVSSRSASPVPATVPSIQLNGPTKHPLIEPFDKGKNTPAEQLEQDDGDSMSASDDLSRPITPMIQAQDQDQDELEVDAQLNENTRSKWACIICRSEFFRMQERNRHVESHLPHSILCPFRGCKWTGRRQWDFQEHWRKKHPEVGQAPREDTNEIYDTKDFVKAILDGKPVEEVARRAFAKVQEGLRRLGKPDVGANVLGRNKELREWIRIPSSQLN